MAAFWSILALGVAQLASSAEVQTLPSVVVKLYSDAACTQPSGVQADLVVAADHCDLDYNHSCSCNGDKVMVVGERYDPSCYAPNKQVVLKEETVLGKCKKTPGLSPDHPFMLMEDPSGSCPPCVAAPPSTCTVYGDPHVTVFDQTSVAFLNVDSMDPRDAFGWGDFWLVKSQLVSIQARYRKVRYPNAHNDQSHTFLTGLAVGGPFMKGNTLIIKPREDRVTWRWTGGDERDILAEVGDHFNVDGVMKAIYHETPLVEDNSVKGLGLTLNLPSDIKLVVNRHTKHLDMALTMSADVVGRGGLDGQCGNFNGDASDDTSALIESRIGYKIPNSDLLF